MAEQQSAASDQPSGHIQGKPIQVIHGLTWPAAITTNSKGHLFVVEQTTDKVFELTRDGHKVHSIGRNFNEPSGIAVDCDDNIYIVDRYNHRVQKFNEKGELLASVGSKDDSQFNSPIGIGYNRTKELLYVCDKHNLKVLSTDLKIQSSFGREGSADGEFCDPCDVCSDKKGNVYVADSTNHRVQVFTATGEFIRKFGSYGIDEGHLNAPRKVAINSSGEIYTCEWGGNRISVFTTTGDFKRVIGERGKKEGQFDHPAGMTIDGDNRVFVSDTINDRIQIF